MTTRAHGGDHSKADSVTLGPRAPRLTPEQEREWEQAADTELGREVRAAYGERRARLKASELGRLFLAYEAAGGSDAAWAAREDLVRAILACTDEVAWRREREAGAGL